MPQMGPLFWGLSSFFVVMTLFFSVFMYEGTLPGVLESSIFKVNKKEWSW